MGRASRSKGNAGELEVRRLYEAHGFTVRGLEGAGDHLALGHGLTIFSEVKRAERLKVPEWLRQTWDEAPDGSLPVLAFRGNRWPWVAALPLDDLLLSYGRYHERKGGRMTRTLDLDSLVLEPGKHEPDSRYCVMEAVAYVAGEPWSDHPKCVSPVIGAFLRRWNDDLNDEDRQLLKPLIPTVVGTKDGNDVARAWLAADWLVRTYAPAFLRLRPELAEYASTLAALPPLVDAVTAQATKPALDAARAAALDAAWAAAQAAALDAALDAARAAAWAAARAAARDAARDAARAAARDAARAAAGDAALDAAWAAARAAALDAAWAAARDAAGDAARAAAGDAARAALRLTVVELQQSALDLVERMVEL